MTPCNPQAITSTLFLCTLTFSPFSAGQDQHSLSAGVWANYQYLRQDEANKNAWGEFGGEALMLYADGKAAEAGGRWRYSAELRTGPGSFTDPLNNTTGDNWALHKAWVGWRINDHLDVHVGKSQVPFGWKTINFWPGDILLAGFGDQMDVGVKFTGSNDAWQYDGAFYLADDWGSSSTDTLDDNGHWGSTNTYRKVQTWVSNLGYSVADDHQFGFSAQAGKLQNLTGLADNPVDGRHWAGVVYYQGKVGNFYSRAAYITMERDLPETYATANSLPDRIENQRLALELGYDWGDWSFYVDLSSAEPDTRGNSADRVNAFAPGLRYDYGPGWLYVEYLTQDGFVDSDGRIDEGDFDALYVSLDFYL